MATRRSRKSAGRILVVDDERAIRSTLSEILQEEGYQVSDAADGKAAIEALTKGNFDVILCDIKMPGVDGMAVLDHVLQEHPETPIIMISGHGTIETAVEAIKRGAYDYIEKPLDLNRLLVSVRNAQDRTELVDETRRLRRRLGDSGYEMIGESEALGRIREMINRVSGTLARVLITGENGTGKELVARALHRQSERRDGPFVEVNCAAIPSELIESELFGHEKGAFTSAIKQRVGKFELASEGTLFLDEIGDMSLGAQSKVLRALQEERITRVGGEKEITVNPRVIAATNKNLLDEISKGNFREDLYHRLGVILIHVPPLRERKEDIPLLVDHFLDEVCTKSGQSGRTIDPEAIALLQANPWRGNVRELRNAVERLVIMTDDCIRAEDVQRHVPYVS